MMDRRLELLLLALAEQYAPQLAQSWDRKGDLAIRLPIWARQLANYNILVIMGDFPSSLQTLGQDVNAHIQDWVNSYGQLYHLLSRALFPSYVHLSAHYTDDKWPVVIYMQGAATPVIQRIAGYVSPYIVQRQLDSTVYEAELIGLMDSIMDELEAGSLPRDTYKALRTEGIVILKQLLAAQIRQLALTEFDRAIFTDSQRFIPIAPERLLLPGDDKPNAGTDYHALPPESVGYSTPHRADTETLTVTQHITPPTTMPESAPAPEKPVKADDAPAKSFGSSIPIFFSRNKDEKKRRPPLPPLPGKKD
jgi:hypothetical protein